MQRWWTMALVASGAPIAAIEVCPHTPADGCDCRKPRPALFRRAADRLGIELAGSFLVGDAPSDIEGAVRLGLRPVRVRTGRGAEPLPEGIRPEVVVDDILAAARWIAARIDDGADEGADDGTRRGKPPDDPTR